MNCPSCGETLPEEAGMSDAHCEVFDTECPRCGHVVSFLAERMSPQGRRLSRPVSVYLEVPSTVDASFIGSVRKTLDDWLPPELGEMRRLLESAKGDRLKICDCVEGLALRIVAKARAANVTLSVVTAG